VFIQGSRHVITSSVRAASAPFTVINLFTAGGELSAHAAEEMLRKAVGKGIRNGLQPAGNALWVATSQSRSLDKGGIVYRLDPTTLEVTQVIHNDLKPFGATINNATQTLWFGNTTDSTVTAIDAKTGAVKGRLVLDNRQRSETVRRWRRVSWRSMKKPTRSISPGWVKRA
jgi:hypothetical protein